MRRVLRRYLPNPEHLQDKRWFRLLGRSLFQPALWHLNRRSAPAAAAIGMLCGLIPGPLQMLGAALLCLVFRANLPLALVSTLYTNPLTIVPLYLVAFRIGSWLTGTSGTFTAPPGFSFAEPMQQIAAWFQWLLSLGQPLMIGLPILAGSLAVLAYAALALAWRVHVQRAWRRRKQR
jgi:uncharacterized protein (DUF2062 family)